MDITEKDMRSHYGAPWSKGLILSSAVFGAVAILPPTVLLVRGRVTLAVLLSAVFFVALSSAIRGYEVTAGELRVRRLFWDVRLPIDNATVATVRPNAMRGSWRVWGNGGMFSVSGHFSGSGLGRYKAFVTNPANTVIVETPSGRIVVSPDRPEEFAAVIAGDRPNRPA